MNLKENRTIAWIVFAVCVLFSLSFSGGGALKNQRADVEHVFFFGAQGDGLCIDKDLSVRAETAYQIADTAANYASIDQSLVAETRDASNALSSAGAISEKADANTRCQHAVESLYTAVDNASLSQKDGEYAYKEYKEFKSRGDTISRDPYNDMATAFNAELGKFPASLVGSLSGVRPLELFQ